MKYRLVKYTNVIDSISWFEIQQRFLFFFWLETDFEFDNDSEQAGRELLERLNLNHKHITKEIL